MTKWLALLSICLLLLVALSHRIKATANDQFSSANVDSPDQHGHNLHKINQQITAKSTLTPAPKVGSKISKEIQAQLSKELIAASTAGNEKSVLKLIHEGANVNATGDDDLTPLHHAAENGHTQVTSILLNHSANIEAKSIYKLTPLHFATKGGHIDVIELLLNHSANIEATNMYNVTPLHVAAMKGRADIASILLNHSANIEARDADSMTPLHYAAFYGQKEMVSVLLSHGADINANAKIFPSRLADKTPLDLAEKGGSINVVEMLEKEQKKLKLKSYLKKP